MSDAEKTMNDSGQIPVPLAPLNGLSPLLSPDIHTIILGSFPSRESLAARQYYAHPRNQFWKLLSAVLDDDLVSLPYEKRLDRLLGHGIGLWDVISLCDRVGSLDSRIRNAVANDFTLLKEICPRLEKVCFNGKGGRSICRKGWRQQATGRCCSPPRLPPMPARFFRGQTGFVETRPG